MVQIPTPTGAAYFQFPIPTGEEIYNQLMAEIEPELMSDELPGLEEKYKDETPEQKQARALRYQKAFEAYDVKYAAYKADLEAKYNAIKKEAVTTLEQMVHDHSEAPLLNALEQKFA